jgi:hypothetical protein
MKISIKKIISLFTIGCSLLFIGYYRDFIFKSINALLKAWDAEMDYSLSPSLHFLENYEYDTLVNIKWGLTLFFTLIYLLISLLSIKILFDKKKYLIITLGMYGCILLLSIILIGIGYCFTSLSEKMYEFVRYLMGIAQSPIVLMLLIPIFKLSEKENTNIRN